MNKAVALLRSVGLAGLIGVLCGLASAIFLHLLERATHYRETHEALVYLLPAAGFVLGIAYDRAGKTVRGGTGIILDATADEDVVIPLKMAPLVLVGTVLTHLFGGSGGREGTAVQMGGSIASALSRRFGLSGDARRTILICGIAGGFGAVFGTPLGGALFAIEVVCVMRPAFGSLVPALTAAFVGDTVTRRLGVVHTPYPVVHAPPFSAALLPKLVLIGLAMAAAGVVFHFLLSHLKKLLERAVAPLAVRMFLAGTGVVALWRLTGTSEFLGLGVPGIVSAFSDPNILYTAFLWKTVFTAVTLSGGFLGGEVTPLFFIGASLGNVLARVLGLPIELGAAAGMAAVFGSAANTPIALAVMTAELVGVSSFPYVLLVCIVAYAVSGYNGIYGAQRLARKKPWGARIDPPKPLREFH